MSKTWFISDTHFHHKNILKYEPCRITALAKYLEATTPFTAADIETAINSALEENNTEAIECFLDEHDDMIIKNWNKTVKKDDIVWFLGDFALGNKERAKKLCARLNGHKRMVRGNHDNWSDDVYRDMGFEYVSKYPIIVKDFFILSHTPIAYMNEHIPFFNIFGHVHSNPMVETHSEHHQCVCIERQDFTPVRIEEFDNAN